MSGAAKRPGAFDSGVRRSFQRMREGGLGEYTGGATAVWRECGMAVSLPSVHRVLKRMAVLQPWVVQVKIWKGSRLWTVAADAPVVEDGRFLTFRDKGYRVWAHWIDLESAARKAGITEFSGAFWELRMALKLDVTDNLTRGWFKTEKGFTRVLKWLARSRIVPGVSFDGCSIYAVRI